MRARRSRGGARRAPAHAPSSRSLGLSVGLSVGLSLGLLGCSGAAPSVGAPGAAGEAGPMYMVVVAEGPCPKLSVQAIGARRLLVFGDTGYDLHAWLPGEPLAAAQSVVELVQGGGAARDPRLLSGLPTDERGYVPADLSLGGAGEDSAWLVRTTTRYEPSGRGALFERSTEGALLGPRGFRSAPAGEVVERPPRARALPSVLPSACGAELSFVPLASTSTPTGGVVIAGRCADRGPTNLPSPMLRVLHGAADAREYRVEAGLETPLDGIVNLSLAAGSDDDVWLAAWEPFEPPERRRPFVAHWNGARWARERLALREAPMSLARTSDGMLWLATGKGLYRRDRGGRVEPVDVPMPHFAKGQRGDVYVHTVRAFGAEVWVEASYRVTLDEKRGPSWASALYTLAARPPSRVVYCDAREPVESAVSLVTPPAASGPRSK